MVSKDCLPVDMALGVVVSVGVIVDYTHHTKRQATSLLMILNTLLKLQNNATTFKIDPNIRCSPYHIGNT